LLLPSAAALVMSDTSAFQKEAEAAQPTAAVLVNKAENERDDDLVTWDGPNDTGNPQHFSMSRKVFITLIWIYGNLVATIASSI
jgi:hypothetical protein